MICAVRRDKTHFPSLREQFPEQASLILDAPDAFVEARDGFRIQRGRALGTWRSLDITLPRESGQAIRLKGFGGYEIRVFETGAAGPASLADHAVRYARPGGTSYWTATANGVEEWLHLDARAETDRGATATWRLEGARLVQAGNSVHAVDSAGVVRLIINASSAYAATGRTLPVQLRAEDDILSLFANAGGEAVLVDPGWTAVTPLPAPRYQHTGSVLQDGKVLIAGGKDQTDHPTPSALIYDPATNAWSEAAPMNEARFAHTATVLADGRVLTLGGWGGPYPNYVDLASAELYDPAANAWHPAAPIKGVLQGIVLHTATLLLDGKVLVVGGVSGPAKLSSAELYDSATNSWTATGGMAQLRSAHTAVVLPGGDVLIAGGASIADVGLASAERYDHTSGKFSSVGSMTFARGDQSAVLLPGGKVLVAGGRSKWFPFPDALTTAERFDPSTNSWSLAQPLKFGRGNHTAERQLGGGSLVAGGAGFLFAPLASAELYSPDADLWMAAASMFAERQLHSSSLLGNGTILVAGGLDSKGAINQAEVYTPEISSCVSIARGVNGDAADGGLRADQPNANLGASSFMNVGYTKMKNAPGAWRALVRFDLSPIPSGVKIVFARLRLMSLGSSAQLYVDVHRSTSTWEESKVTWASFGNGFEATAVGQIVLTPQFVGIASLEVTGTVAAWLSGAFQNTGFLLKDNHEANQVDELVHFATSEAADAASRPALDVCWVQP